MNTILLNYWLVFLLFAFASFLSFVILLASFVLVEQKPDTEKLLAYESGFDPFTDSRSIFEVRFFLVGILFILFDLEAVFIFPFVVSLSKIGFFGFGIVIDFILELILGFVYIWKVGVLEWS